MHVAVGGPPLDAGDPRDDQIRRLRACVRDLVALSTVPAMWQGSDLETTARNMAGLLLSTSRLEYAFLNVHRVGAEPLAIAEWRAPDEAGDRGAWVVSTRQVMHARRPFEPFEFHIGAATPLRAMTLPLGIDARQGIALVASASSDFPSETEQVLLRVSATQYAISLRSAALLEEARGAEERSRLDSAAAQLARAEAEAANRAKADFLASMSHELRTPLNAIGGYAALMEMGLRGPVTAQQVVDLQRIRRSQEYLLRLINDVLNFAKLEAGHIHVDHAEVEVDQVLDHLEELVGPQVAGKHLECTCKRGDAPLVALGDREKVLHILLNLVANAVKFTDAGGRLEISCRASDRLVHIDVSDTGIGIPADKLAVIFDPFVQVPRDLQTTRDGVGLGLAISRDLARAMGGDLVVTSAVGKGSTFSLTLPAFDAAIEPPSPRSAHPGSGGNGA